MTQPLISVSGASFGYGGRAIVRAESLRLFAGRCLGIFGSNGSGKTTLIRGLTGLLQPMTGEVRRAGFLRIGYLSQYRGIDTTWPMTGIDAAAIAISAGSRWGWIGRVGREQIQLWLARLGVEALADHPFATLSGGQQQRLLLAGALAAKPNLLVLDEPTDGLDIQSRGRLLELIAALCSEGLGVAVISHDVQDLMEICNEVAWVDPAAEASGPATVNVITPSQLADHIVHSRKLA